ncbi:MAG: dihydroorotase [Patescibacteria group bacterium]|nr:dihydroorotase [Patescibacteria group bacterium]
MSTLTHFSCRKGFDFHLHLRRKEMLRAVIAFTAAQFAGALIMPNTRPAAIRTGVQARDYADEIKTALGDQADNFKLLMSIEITEATTVDDIIAAYAAGVRVGKMYPSNQTTNSEDGVTVDGYQKLFPVFAQMERLGMVLSIHGEIPDFTIDGIHRELYFLPIVDKIAKAFTKLRIVLEHITTKFAVDYVITAPANVAATITVHHLLLTLDDVIGYSQPSGGKMQPHHFCKPIAKFTSDRIALIGAATSGNPKFFYGGDSAPHSKFAKECAECCAGVFNASVAMQLLVQIFEAHHALDKLENFISTFGCRVYEQTPSDELIELVREDWQVPADYFVEGGDAVVPLMANQVLPWRLKTA